MPEERRSLDRSLKSAVLRGEEDAWRSVYERNEAALWGFLRSRCGTDPELVSEAFQETWITAVRRARSFDPERGSWRSWLLGIAKRVLVAVARKRGVAPAALPPDGPPDASAAQEPEAVNTVMDGLAPRYRHVLLAKYEQRLSVAEIASATGQTVKAVESLLSRARAAFKDRYREELR